MDASFCCIGIIVTNYIVWSRNWEEIYDASKAKLVNRIGGSPSTDLSIAKEELNHKSEELTQDLSDFLKGLKTVTGYVCMLLVIKDLRILSKNFLTLSLVVERLCKTIQRIRTLDNEIRLIPIVNLYHFLTRSVTFNVCLCTCIASKSTALTAT